MLLDFCARGNKNLTGYRTARGTEKATSTLDERIELGALHRAYGQVFFHKGEFDSARHQQFESAGLCKITGIGLEPRVLDAGSGNTNSTDHDDRGRAVRLIRTVSPEPAVTNAVCSSWQTEECRIQRPRPPISRQNLGSNGYLNPGCELRPKQGES